jgi:muramoyltetrapeptide carboxypeptidase LdcA involved in peptidoglycan recycling
MSTIPRKLKSGDTIRVVAPSSSMGIISKEVREIAAKRFSDLGLNVTFGAHVEEMDDTTSSSIASRVADLHDAFFDSNVAGVFAVIGGFNCNQLLRYIDWDLIRKNPKVFIGYSDTTALQNAILAKTDLVTYSRPAYSTFGQKLYFEYTLDGFKKCLMSDAPYDLAPSDAWTDDAWYLDQDNRTLVPNDGFLPIIEGEALGTIMGGNLCTLNLLQGTDYFPDISNSILFIEDDEETDYKHFDRDLESLLSVPAARSIRGIVFGRFQKKSDMTPDKIKRLIAIRPWLKNIPIVANADFGHTSPLATFPLGGKAKLIVKKDEVKCTITEH